MGSNHRGQYPHDWKRIAHEVKDAAGWRCVRCGHPHESPGAHVDCDDGCDVTRHPEWNTRDIGSPARRGPDGRIWVLGGKRRQRVLTVAHLDDNKGNDRWWNLAALCQVCHLSTQSRIEMERPWVITPHSAWFRPYVAGFYAFKYLGQDLTRAEVEARLDELLALESHAVGVAHG